MLPRITNPRIEMALNLSGALLELTMAAKQAAEGKLKSSVTQRSKGITLRPGAATPAWNELVKLVQPFLKRRGEKIKLARILGVPRQRIHEYFVTCKTCPDAERVLVLLIWVAARKQGREFTGETLATET